MNPRLRRRVRNGAIAAAVAAVLACLPDPVLSALTDVGAVTGFYAGAFFVGGYHLLTQGKWRGSDMGVNVMVVCASVTALFGLRCLALVFGDGFPGQAAAKLVLFAAVAGALIWRTKIMVVAQMANLRDEEDQL